MSQGHDGARAKESAAGTESHQTAAMTQRSGKRCAAQAPGMLPTAVMPSMTAVRMPTQILGAPRRSS